MFLFYISRLFKVIEKHLPQVHGYADDTQIYFSFRPNTIKSQEYAVDVIEECIKDIRAWMIVNQLKINDNKTEFLIIGSRQQLSKVNLQSINVGECEIVAKSEVRNLGAWFDRNMKMDKHIGNICAKAFRGLYMIRQIRKYLDVNTTKTLVHSFVTSHLDYGNALLAGLPKCQYDRLQRILNSAARVIYYVGKYEHITPTLHRLHWLPVPQRVKFKILLLVYKALHGYAPDYIKDLINLETRSSYSLRSNGQYKLVVPRTVRKTFGDRAFAHAGPQLWNSLPLWIKNAETLDQFKNKLKTFLFSDAYGCA
jgi:hypothetical protein